MSEVFTGRGWMKLDNAAKIYPAAMRKNWTASFRFSLELKEAVDPELLRQALACAVPRFPGFVVRLRRGMFWFYLEHSDETPEPQPDVANPCVRMNLKENKRFMFRVRYYNTRIAMEFFHVLTDGTGALCFLKTLTAEYLRLKYGAEIPRGNGILDCTQPPRPEEFEDAFVRYAGEEVRSRKESDAFYLSGTEEPPEVIHFITGDIPAAEIIGRAKELGVSLTEYLVAGLIFSIDNIQRRVQPRARFWRPVKICVPVSLRRFFPSETLRNFSLYVNPGIDPKLGRYSFEEIAKIVHHQMGLEVTEKNLRARFATNVRTEQSAVLRLTPLFLKNIVMRIAFARVGDRKTTTVLSNLGRMELPEEMARYVARADMMLGPLSRNRVAVSAISYDGLLHVTFTSTIRETDLPREFFRQMVRMGIPVKVESNNGLAAL